MDSDLEKKSETAEGSQSQPLAPPESEFPEGGRKAWSVVFGSFLAFIASFGMVNAYGVFQDYYSTTLIPKSSSSTISLIGAIQLFFLYGAGPIVGKVYDAYGTSILIPLGSFLTVFSLMMVSLAQHDQPYQLFLAHGLLFGMGIACLFNPALAVIGHWFKRKRAYAIGIVASGSSVGGVFFPIMLQRLIASVGFPWAVRAAAFICLGCLTGSCLLIRTRLPPSRNLSLRGLIDLDGFRDWKYVLAGIGAFLIFYAFWNPYFYIEIYADYQNVRHGLAIYLLPIINAFGLPSRIIPGILADRFGWWVISAHQHDPPAPADTGMQPAGPSALQPDRQHICAGAVAALAYCVANYGVCVHVRSVHRGVRLVAPRIRLHHLPDRSVRRAAR
ncbi:hypothetical protein AcW1_002526 [Taiwanofungus camphoratus]|nr:hypothetical protein AcW1_002526 [Antrodia cinnamomea]